MDAASSKNDQGSPADTSPNGGQTHDADAIEKIRHDLEKAGFTDVKVVARSFVVQAISSDGNPVLMTIGPHGMSVFEAMSGAGSNSGTVGMSSRVRLVVSPSPSRSSCARTVILSGCDRIGYSGARINSPPSVARRR
ncbi:hypothetical protein [Bradyrhizobium sp. CCBAU 51627]|uniref:hypothetical protein n=1 Tax=Bradyrhizobium sp. CCBAU 51627 TaxID=1325088 RepID=UPI002305F51C|nr:hypothetical protein [Bradyrhizobium sp. CCBAU 51627]